MPTQEQVDEFFLEFAREMKDQGLFIMDHFVEIWPNIPTADEVREMEAEGDSDASDYEDITQIH